MEAEDEAAKEHLAAKEVARQHEGEVKAAHSGRQKLVKVCVFVVLYVQACDYGKYNSAASTVQSRKKGSKKGVRVGGGVTLSIHMASCIFWEATVVGTRKRTRELATGAVPRLVRQSRRRDRQRKIQKSFVGNVSTP